jgi:uncharacterized membrane protein YczE
MEDKNLEVVKIIGAMFFQIILLIAGVICIGIGTNAYVATGVLCLLLYSNMAKDQS